MGDIQSVRIKSRGSDTDKEAEIHSLWVTEWAIIEELSYYAINIDVGGH